MEKIILEAPVFNLQGALEAAKFGIDRLELCANFPEGGETPSAGMLRYLKGEIDIPVFVMIRPRGGDFVYSEKELLVMKQDIQLLGDLGADGFVFGVLDEKGKVNMQANEFLRRAAGDKPCTFHRAFDASSDLYKSLEAIIQLGFDRILTSGGKNTLSDGLEVITQLLEVAKDRIVIMPGGGTKSEHIPQLKKTGWLREVHASCKVQKASKNEFVNPDLNFSAMPIDYSVQLGIDPEVVAGFKAVL